MAATGCWAAASSKLVRHKAEEREHTVEVGNYVAHAWHTMIKHIWRFVMNINWYWVLTRTLIAFVILLASFVVGRIFNILYMVPT